MIAFNIVLLIIQRIGIIPISIYLCIYSYFQYDHYFTESISKNNAKVNENLSLGNLQDRIETLNTVFNWQITILAIFAAEFLTIMCCFCINKLCIKAEDDAVYNLNHSDLRTAKSPRVIKYDEESAV